MFFLPVAYQQRLRLIDIRDKIKTKSDSSVCVSICPFVYLSIRLLAQRTPIRLTRPRELYRINAEEALSIVYHTLSGFELMHDS